MTHLTKTQKVVLTAAIVPMVAVAVAGGIGTYSNISHAYGGGTAIGALAAGEGATAVLAFTLVGLTLLGQSSPFIIRLGLWALPAAAALMAATAAEDGMGQTIVYAVTPMAITAGAEGLAFLVRRIVVHQEGRDVEAEARAASVVRELAYHQARVTSHPSTRVRARSVRRSWRLARALGGADAALDAQLMDVQRARLVDGAAGALAAMFAPGAPALPAGTIASEAGNRDPDAGIEDPGAGTDVPAESPDTADARREPRGHDAGTEGAQVIDYAERRLARTLPALSAAPVVLDKHPAGNAGPEAGNRDADAGTPLVDAAADPGEAAPDAGTPDSIAAAVRIARTRGVTQPAAIAAWVPDLLGREPNKASLMREIRRQLNTTANNPSANADRVGPYL